MQTHTYRHRVFLMMTFLLFAGHLFAQTGRKNDVIVKRDSTQIQALIIQMSYEKINYRDLGTADSAKSYISLDQVARVLLKNGKTINVRDSVLAGKIPTDTVGQYADMNNLPTNPFEREVVMANSDQLRDRYEYYHNKAIDGRTGTIVFTSVAVATLISGIIVTAVGDSPDDKTIGTSLAIAGPVAGGVLGLISFRNFKRNQSRANKVKSELERRGQSLSSIDINPGFNPLNKSAQLSLRISF